jgi:hypothetical protein
MSIVLDKIGLELECSFLTREHTMEALQAHELLGYLGEVHRDASVETPVFSLGEHNIICPPGSLLSSQLRRRTLGSEIVTRPLSREETTAFISKVSMMLQKLGEDFTPRTSIHVHIGFPNSLVCLKRALKVGLLVEPYFYRLAGLGNRFRGEINSSIYCRPLARGPCVQSAASGNWYVLKPEVGLTATNPFDFWKGFGIPYREGTTDYGRYIPARYFAFNLYSTLLRGTLEYRFFNMTSRYEWILTMVDLIQALTEFIISGQEFDAGLELLPKLNSFEIYEDAVYEEFTRCLLELLKNGDLYYNSILNKLPTLLGILQKTPHHVIGPADVQTHVREQGSMDYVDRLNLERVRNPVPSGYVDIHTTGIENQGKLLV